MYFGKAIKAYRRRNGITQSELADRLNDTCTWGALSTSAKDISNWERAHNLEQAHHNAAPYNAVLAVSRLTGIGVVELMTFPEV